MWSSFWWQRSFTPTMTCVGMVALHENALITRRGVLVCLAGCHQTHEEEILYMGRMYAAEGSQSRYRERCFSLSWMLEVCLTSSLWSPVVAGKVKQSHQHHSAEGSN
jgi:hypothetical protein